MKKVLLVLFVLCTYSFVFAQDTSRYKGIEQKLNELSNLTSGLNQKIDISVSGVTVQEFLRAVSELSDLNINVDPNINNRVYNNFNQEQVKNILLFVVKEYNLDINFTGTIMSFVKYVPLPKVIESIPQKEIIIRYNSYNNLLTLDLKEDTLSKVVKKITQITKKNLILAPGIADKRVNVYLEDLPFDDAIQKFAYTNELGFVKTADQVYILKKMSEEDDLLTIAQGNKKPSDRRKTNRSNSSQKQEIYVEIETDTGLGDLLTIEAFNSQIVDIIKAVSQKVGISYFLYSEIKGSANLSIEHVKYESFLTNLLNGTEYTFRQENGIYLIGERKLEGLRSNKFVQLQNRSLDDIIETIPAEIKKGVEIKAFKELNSILLTGASPQIEEINTFIHELDKVVPLVTIEVILLDIKKGKSVKTGIKAGLSDSVKSGGTILPGVDFTWGAKSINQFLSNLGNNTSVNLGRVTPNFYVSLSALENNNNIEVRSMPKLSTLNGHDATLSIGNTRYYTTTTQNVIGSLNPQTVVTQQFNDVQANLSITITPVVSGDEQVTLKIDVKISDFTGDPPENSPPPYSTSQFKSIIRARNDEMIVLGGIERTEKSENGTGVPVLARIPVLKWFFSSRSKSSSKVVSVVFIKPTIIY